MKFRPKKLVAIDTETTGLNVWKDDAAFAVGMCDESGETWYCQWPVNPYTREVEPDLEDLEVIRELACDPNIEKVFHNAKFDCRMLSNIGVHMEGRIHDTHIAARVCNNIEIQYGLKYLAHRYLKIPASDEADLLEEVRKARRTAGVMNKHAAAAGKPLIKLGNVAEEDYWLPKFMSADSDKCEEYCKIDTVRTMGLHIFYQNIISEDEHLQLGYREEMFDLWPVVNRMEERGMRINPERVVAERDRAREEMRTHLAAMIQIIKERGLKPFGKESVSLDTFNPNSTPQIKRLLYLSPKEGGLGLSSRRITKGSGAMSTDKHSLRELMHEPFVRHLATYRSAEQAVTLFFDKYLRLMVDDPRSQKNGKPTGAKIIRPGLNQCGTTTFRFSCSNPNMQQVSSPKISRDQGGGGIYPARAPFGPRDGYFWYAADYSQQELRWFTEIAQIPFLLKEISEGRDPNNSMANRVWGGKGNEGAVKAAALALELGLDRPTNEKVSKTWEEIGWCGQLARENGYKTERTLAVADEWLSRFDYDIVAAEKSLDRANSRQRIKCVMFAKIYGGGPNSIIELIYCTVDEARLFFADYDRMFPEVNAYMADTIRKVRRDGFIINPYGRKVRVDTDFAYKAVNYMIQGTAACQMKKSIVRCDEYMRKSGLDAHVLMTIHDELLFEVAQRHAYKWLLRGIQDIMEDTQGRAALDMPVEVKRVRDSWDDKEAIDL